MSTNTFDAVRSALAHAEDYTDGKLVEMATTMRHLCEYRDELEQRLAIAERLLVSCDYAGPSEVSRRIEAEYQKQRAGS